MFGNLLIKSPKAAHTFSFMLGSMSAFRRSKRKGKCSSQNLGEMHMNLQSDKIALLYKKMLFSMLSVRAFFAIFTIRGENFPRRFLYKISSSMIL